MAKIIGLCEGHFQCVFRNAETFPFLKENINNHTILLQFHLNTPPSQNKNHHHHQQQQQQATKTDIIPNLFQ